MLCVLCVCKSVYCMYERVCVCSSSKGRACDACGQLSKCDCGGGVAFKFCDTGCGRYTHMSCYCVHLYVCVCMY